MSIAEENTCPTTQSVFRFAAIQPWLVCLSAALFFFYEFIQMSLFNSISSELMQDFHINATELGNLSATYFYADVLFLLPAGMILDRLRVKTVIILSMIVCIAGTFFFALSQSALTAAVCHFMAGIGNAFCFISCIMLASRWFPPRQMALAIGLIVTLGMLGGVVAQTPFTQLVLWLGWRHAVMVNVAIGVAIFALIAWVVKDYPPGYQHKAKAQLAQASTQSRFLLAAANPQNWLAGLYTCLLNLPVFLLGQLWGNMYLTQVHHLSHTQASTVAMMIFFGTMIGSPLVGWISDTLRSRRIPMLVGGILSLAVVLVILFIPLSFGALFFLFLLLGILTSAQIISYPLIAESNPAFLTGTATGLASVLIMSGGAIFQPLFGWLMDLHWNHTLIDGAPIYTASNYLLAMTILPVAFILGLIAAFCLRETRCHSLDTHQ